MMTKIITKLVLLSLVLIEIVLAKPVSVFDKKVGQLVTSSLLTWEPFHINNLKQLEYAVVGGEFSEKHPAYICRSSINSIAVSGYVKKRSEDSYVCIISQHSQIKTKGEFEILINKGNGAKTEWSEWGKSSVIFQHIDGTVSTINGGGLRSEVYYIARHKRNQSMEHHEIDHAIGWFDPTEGFGKIHATVASVEETFDSGEILTTFEPIRYELHEIKFKSLKLRETKNRTLLGQTMLKNEEDKPTEVNAMIGYEFNQIRNLGHLDGIARSVNTTVYANKKEIYSFFWGIQQDVKILNTKGVGLVLEPGTALNITLWGNYTIKEGPYDANLVIHYADGTKSKKRRIIVNNGMEANLEDQLDIEYSPIFWLHNNTVVPTTTQKTTVTSSTSSSSSAIHKSIFSTSMSSNTVERITEKSSVKADNIMEEIDDDDEENEVASKTNDAFKIPIASSILALVIVNLIHFINAH